MILEILAEILFELIFFKLPVFLYRKVKLFFIKQSKIRKNRINIPIKPKLTRFEK